MTFYSAFFLALMASIITFFGYFPGLSLVIGIALLIGILLTFLLGVYAGRAMTVAGKSTQDSLVLGTAALTAVDSRPKPHLVGPDRRPQTSISLADKSQSPLDRMGQRIAG